MNPTLVVLLAEDDPNDVVFLKRAIGQLKLPLLLMVVNDGEEAIAYLGGSVNIQTVLIIRYPFYSSWT